MVRLYLQGGCFQWFRCHSLPVLSANQTKTVDPVIRPRFAGRLAAFRLDSTLRAILRAGTSTRLMQRPDVPGAGYRYGICRNRPARS